MVQRRLRRHTPQQPARAHHPRTHQMEHILHPDTLHQRPAAKCRPNTRRRPQTTDIGRSALFQGLLLLSAVAHVRRTDNPHRALRPAHRHPHADPRHLRRDRQLHRLRSQSGRRSARCRNTRERRRTRFERGRLHAQSQDLSLGSRGEIPESHRVVPRLPRRPHRPHVHLGRRVIRLAHGAQPV